MKILFFFFGTVVMMLGLIPILNQFIKIPFPSSGQIYQFSIVAVGIIAILISLMHDNIKNKVGIR